MATIDLPTPASVPSPRSGSGASSNAKMRLLEVMPFIATWKYDPSCRRGIKNSADNSTISTTEATLSVLVVANCHRATPMPTAVPP